MFPDIFVLLMKNRNITFFLVSLIWTNVATREVNDLLYLKNFKTSLVNAACPLEYFFKNV